MNSHIVENLDETIYEHHIDISHPSEWIFLCTNVHTIKCPRATQGGGFLRVVV